MHFNNSDSNFRILIDERKHIGVENKQLKRKDLLTRKDINNIKTSYKIHVNDGVRHKDDATSVDLWVKECSGEFDSSPVIFYKKQGHFLDGYNFNKEDFCLIIITPAQQNILENIANNIICVDSTHGLNSYDFEMTTLLVVDEYGEGFPGSCMYSNRKDTYTFKVFFEKIKEKCGNMKCRVFMSDIAPAFYNAWQNVMGSVPFHLYCSWHVDRCWQKNLNKVADKQKRKLLYQHLKCIQYTLGEEEFEIKLQNLLTSLNDVALTEFKKYFLENYVYIKKQWAYAYRKECNINTNMHLENMHKNLKYLYFDGKKIKRMDKSIHMLLIFIHEKSVERLIKLTKGKTTKHMIKIHACHRAAAIATNYKIFYSSENDILIRNDTNGKEYQLFKNNVQNCCNIRCNFCNICIHGYKCTCMDFLIRSIICKHIHFLLLNGPSAQIDKFHENVTVENNSQFIESLTQSEATVELKKQQIKNDVSAIITKIDNKSLSFNKIATISQHVKIAKELLCLDGSESSNTKFMTKKSELKEPHNKKINKQDCFFSTKKKNLKKDAKYFKKPNEDEKAVIEGLLHDHSY